MKKLHMGSTQIFNLKHQIQRGTCGTELRLRAEVFYPHKAEKDYTLEKWERLKGSSRGLRIRCTPWGHPKRSRKAERARLCIKSRLVFFLSDGMNGSKIQLDH